MSNVPTVQNSPQDYSLPSAKADLPSGPLSAMDRINGASGFPSPADADSPSGLLSALDRINGAPGFPSSADADSPSGPLSALDRINGAPGFPPPADADSPSGSLSAMDRINGAPDLDQALKNMPSIAELDGQPGMKPVNGATAGESGQPGATPQPGEPGAATQPGAAPRPGESGAAPRPGEPGAAPRLGEPGFGTGAAASDMGTLSEIDNVAGNQSGMDAAAGIKYSIGTGEKPAEVPAEMWNNITQAAEETGQDPYTIAAIVKKETNFGAALVADSPASANGLMQVSSPVREEKMAEFEETFGSAYSDSELDQIRMGSLVLEGSGGDLKVYNRGENWEALRPALAMGAREYEASVNAIRDELING